MAERKITKRLLTVTNILGKIYRIFEVSWIMPNKKKDAVADAAAPAVEEDYSDLGECDPPETPAKEIRIWEKLEGKQRLEVELHEFVHAADWFKAEVWVNQFGKDAARYLWKLGYRKVK